jgi:hypothetical protein
MTAVKRTATVGGGMLAEGAETEKGTEFVVSSAEPLGHTECLEASHTSNPTFDASVILLQSIVAISAGPW